MFLNVFEKGMDKLNKFLHPPNKFSIKGKEYTEEKLLAEGGYGYVYMVSDSEDNKFALKKMNIQSKETLQNIKQEVKLWNKVNNCKNIVKMLDYELTETFILILMELCTEGSLFDYITANETAIPEQTVLFITREVCNGINFMHQQDPPIAHRDIKIENVLRFGKTFKLCDFGSASSTVVDPKKNDKSFILDQFSIFEKTTTFMYRPPEMCDQYAKYYINEKVDIWMLGCIFYALLFKKHPFQDAQKLTIINAYYFIPADHNYSEKVIDFLRLMLTPNPANRPSAQDVINIINDWKNTKIELSDEVLEIKRKQDSNKPSSKGKMNLLSDEDIKRLQGEILKKEKKNKKSVYHNKNEDDDYNDMFDDDEADTKYSGSGNNNTKKTNNFDFDPFAGINNSKNSNSNNHGNWDVDFNQMNNNNNSNNNTGKVTQTVQFENFDFEFCDTGSTGNKNSSNNTNSNNTSNTNSNKNVQSQFDQLDLNFHNTNQKPTSNSNNSTNFTHDFDFTSSNTNNTNNKNTFSSNNNNIDYSNFDFINSNSNNTTSNTKTNNTNTNNQSKSSNPVNIKPSNSNNYQPQPKVNTTLNTSKQSNNVNTTNTNTVNKANVTKKEQDVFDFFD